MASVPTKCRGCGTWVEAHEFHGCSRLLASYGPDGPSLTRCVRCLADAVGTLTLQGRELMRSVGLCNEHLALAWDEFESEYGTQKAEEAHGE